MEKLKAKLSKLVNFEICSIQFGGSANSLLMNCTYAGDDSSKSTIKIKEILALKMSYELAFSEEAGFIAGISIDIVETEEDLLIALDKENYPFTNYSDNYEHVLPLYLLQIDGDICIKIIAKEII